MYEIWKMFYSIQRSVSTNSHEDQIKNMPSVTLKLGISLYIYGGTISNSTPICDIFKTDYFKIEEQFQHDLMKNVPSLTLKIKTEQ